MARKKPMKDAKPRETGTAGQSGTAAVPPTKNLPPDPQTLGRPMTPSEKVDEASLESMDGSDPPSYSPGHSGGPDRAAEDAAVPEEAVRRHAYALWDQDGRPSGRDQEYWHRAERELRKKAGKSG